MCRARTTAALLGHPITPATGRRVGVSGCWCGLVVGGLIPPLWEAGSPRRPSWPIPTTPTRYPPRSSNLRTRSWCPDEVAVAAFLAGYSSGTRVSYTTDLRDLSPGGATTTISTSSTSNAHTLSCSAGGWNRKAGWPPRSPDACRRCRRSTKYCQIEDTITKNPAANIRRPRLTASPAPLASTATNSVPCWSRQVSGTSETVPS
jgi:hypothetical protein